MIDNIFKRAVSNRALVRLLSSPVRQEIVDTLATLGGEAGVASLADQLGLPADGLYYHLRALVAGGLVDEIPGHSGAERWTCNGFVPVTYLTTPLWLRTRAG